MALYNRCKKAFRYVLGINISDFCQQLNIDLKPYRKYIFEMKKHLLAVGVICASLLTLSAKDADPVLMTVAGKKVPVSEFAYLYHKNNSQQSQPQSIDDYVGMFVDYKLKVADAEAAGIDTTAAFVNEFTKFRNELAEPYFQDNSVMEALIEEAYNHKLEEVTVSHIMVREEQRELLDSVRAQILRGDITFEDAARKYSLDTNSARRGGAMGNVIPGRYPWAFEEVAYNTPVGEISQVVNSGFGLHLIRPDNRRPSRGEVSAKHILRLTRGANDSVMARQKEIIDSIYTVVVANPDKFEEIAMSMSEDPGSGRRGGDLGWFGGGQMVAEFDSVAFALPDGAISKPFRTNFGWHIIKKTGSRGVGSLEASRAEIAKQIKSGERAKAPAEAYLRQARAKYNAYLMYDRLNEIAPLANSLGEQLDSAMIASLAVQQIPVFAVGSRTVYLPEIMASVMPVPVKGGEAIQDFITTRAQNMMDGIVLDNARADLYASTPDYRNLVNEYRDGILLFEISNRNVWDKAAKDKEGIEKFFEANRTKYKWDEPRFKAMVIFANSDTLLNNVVAYLDELPKDMASADVVASVRERFGRDIKIERVIAAKGENPITDYLGFGQEKPAEENPRWKYYIAYGGRIIDVPEEYADVRGAAVADYQEALERAWVADLHKKYPVKINKGNLKKVK